MWVCHFVSGLHCIIYFMTWRLPKWYAVLILKLRNGSCYACLLLAGCASQPISITTVIYEPGTGSATGWRRSPRSNLYPPPPQHHFYPVSKYFIEIEVLITSQAGLDSTSVRLAFSYLFIKFDAGDLSMPRLAFRRCHASPSLGRLPFTVGGTSFISSMWYVHWRGGIEIKVVTLAVVVEIR